MLCVNEYVLVFVGVLIECVVLVIGVCGGLGIVMVKVVVWVGVMVIIMGCCKC